MKVAISGGTGFVGRALVQALCARGDECVVFSRDPASARLPQGAIAEKLDEAEPLPPERLHGADAVVNLAGESVATRWTAEVKRRIKTSRVATTLSLVQAAQTAGTVKRFVSASAVGYYGNDRGAVPLTESSSPGSDYLAEVCHAWESAANTASTSEMRVVLLRIGVVLHPEGGALEKMLTPIRLGVGGRIASGKQYVSWIHRDDLVSMILFALENDAVQGPINATAPEPVTNAELTLALAKKLRRPAIFPVPAFALRALFGEMADNITGGQRVLPHRAEELGFTFRYPRLDTLPFAQR